MGRTRQDRTKIKEEKKKRQNSDYEASLKKPKVSTNPPTCQTTETKPTHTKKRKKKERKKKKVSKAATLKISRVIKRHPNNNKKVKKYG